MNSHLLANPPFAMRYVFSVLGLFLLSFLSPARAQEVIIHGGSTNLEDGDPEVDADGTKNGVVIWKSGSVHVVIGRYWTEVGERTGEEYDEVLEIESGAIVKMAGSFKVDDVGNVTEWNDTNPSGGSPRLGGDLRINGATITSIQDDSVGGDTNQDGDATNGDSAGRYDIALTSDHGEIVGSSVRGAHVVVTGSPMISHNEFVSTYIEAENEVRLISGPTGERICDGAPFVMNNVFEEGGIVLRGTAPVISGNTISGGGIVVGPQRWRDSWCPSSGTIIVEENSINGAGEIQLEHLGGRTADEVVSVYQRLQAVIRNNVIHGDGTNVGIDVPIDVHAEVTGNETANVSLPIMLESYDSSMPNVSINDNRFESLSGRYAVNLSSSFMENGLFVNAENNYWGAQSGPFDPSDADGLFNPRGNGARVGNFLDYVPFRGNPVWNQDDVQIDVSSSAAEPLQAGGSATFNVTAIKLDLFSAQKGVLIARVFDEAGDVLGSAMQEVTSDDRRATLPAITFTVPEYEPFIYVAATLLPEGSRSIVESNQIRFKVNSKAVGKLSLKSVDQLPNGGPPIAIAGKTLKVRVTLTYTLITGENRPPGTIEVYADERTRGTRDVLRRFPISGGPLVSLRVPEGEHLEAEGEVTIDVPLRDATEYPRGTELRGKIVLRDADGNVLVKTAARLPVASPAVVSIKKVYPTSMAGGAPLGRDYFIQGEAIVIGVPYQISIGDPSASWKSTVRVYVWNPYSESWTTAAEKVRDQRFDVSSTFYLSSAEIGGVQRMRVELTLTNTDEGVVVASDSFTLEPYDAATSETREVASGSSDVDLGATGVRLRVRRAQKPGSLTADKVIGALSSLFSKADGWNVGSVARKQGVVPDHLIPLNHFWGIYGDLSDEDFEARVEFAYDPAADFPDDGDFIEDSLVVAALNPLSGELEVLPSEVDTEARVASTDYTSFFQTYVVASGRSASVVSTDDADQIPQGFALEPVYPNPFNPSTTIAFRQADAGRVRIAVYDVLGRTVRVLIDDVLASGAHRATWDGRRENGAEAATGVYFVRMEADGFAEVRTAVLAR